MYIATISSKNQITLPVRMLRKLYLKSGSKILLEEKDEGFLIKPVEGSIVDAVAGSLNKHVLCDKLNKSLEDIKEEADEKYTKYLAKKHKLKK